jgi:hypothetical protein
MLILIVIHSTHRSVTHCIVFEGSYTYYLRVISTDLYSYSAIIYFADSAKAINGPITTILVSRNLLEALCEDLRLAVIQIQDHLTEEPIRPGEPLPRIIRLIESVDTLMN